MDVKTLCLGALTFGDMAGYDIKKYFEDAFSHFYLAGFGSIYPALRSLTEEGLVTCTSIPQEKRPDKKVYHLTDAGWDRFREVLLQTPTRHKVRSEFLVLMYFAHLLPSQRLVEVLDDQLHQWEAVLEALREIEACPEPLEPGIRFGLGYGLTIMTAAVNYVRDHRGELMQALEANR